jgi:hypothetical protein
MPIGTWLAPYLLVLAHNVNAPRERGIESVRTLGVRQA